MNDAEELIRERDAARVKAESEMKLRQELERIAVERVRDAEAQAKHYREALERVRAKCVENIGQNEDGSSYLIDDLDPREVLALLPDEEKL